MLKLTNIVKEYVSGDSNVAALRGVDISNKETDDIIRIALKNLSR